jgi:hypothetical protein
VDHGSGFLTVPGPELFWISVLHLPIVGSLQIEDRRWVFVQDQVFHFPQAVATTQRALHAILPYGRA